MLRVPGVLAQLYQLLKLHRPVLRVQGLLREHMFHRVYGELRWLFQRLFRRVRKPLRRRVRRRVLRKLRLQLQLRVQLLLRRVFRLLRVRQLFRRVYLLLRRLRRMLRVQFLLLRAVRSLLRVLGVLLRVSGQLQRRLLLLLLVHLLGDVFGDGGQYAHIIEREGHGPPIFHEIKRRILPMAKKIITVSQETVNRIQALQYECVSRQSLLKFMLDNGTSLSSEGFRAYHEEYERYQTAYETAKEEFQKNELEPAVEGTLLSWNLDFATREAACEYAEN